MHIAIDAHTVGTQLAGNVSYITNLIESLAEIDKFNQYTLYVSKPAAVARFAGRWANFTVRRMRLQNPILRYLFSLSMQIRLRPPDILLVQFNAPPRAPCRIVTSIHDLSYEHLPETFNRRSYLRMRLTIRHTAKHAAHIITCSDYSRADIIETYKISPEKISTVLLAASADIGPVTDKIELARVRQKYDLPGDFILGVGSIQPRKNLVRLIEAYAALVKKNTDTPPLVLAGKKAWLFEESVTATAIHGVEDRVRFTDFVPDEDLSALYSLATCFVYPSFFEGFGLPPLEAMQCGAPVITGNLTSLPEVVGDAGIMVDPFDTRAIADAIERVLGDVNLREEMRQKGFERAKMFTWRQTARQTLDVFEKIMSARSAENE